MLLRSDYVQAIQPFPVNALVSGDDTGRCRVRIWEPEYAGDHHVVLVEDLIDNPGPSTTNAIMVIASDVFTAHRKTLDPETTLVFEYRSSEVRRGGAAPSVDQAVIKSWRVRNVPFPSPGNGGIEVTAVEWRPLGIQGFETLIGEVLS